MAQIQLASGDWISFAELKAYVSDPTNAHLKPVLDVYDQWMNEASDFEMFTSGSSGKPKSIRHSKSSMKASARKTAAYFDLPAGSTALLCLPVGFVAGSMMIIRALVMNWKLVVTSPRALPLKGINETLDFAAMTPYQVKASLEDSRADLEKPRTLIIGGAHIMPQLELKLKQLQNGVYATYGMTETLTHVAVRKLNGPDMQSDFHCLEGVEYTWDDRKCLVIEAGHLDQKRIVTNDRVEPTGMRSFEWIGRIDQVINSGGVKLHPEQIEQKLAGLIDTRYYIKGIPDDLFGERVALVLERAPFDPHTARLFKATLKEVLDKFERPDRLIFKPTFEETPTGKIKRI